jgi:hypothetical protein
MANDVGSTTVAASDRNWAPGLLSACQPSQNKYRAPRSLRTVKAVADAAIAADMPALAQSVTGTGAYDVKARRHALNPCSPST